MGPGPNRFDDAAHAVTSGPTGLTLTIHRRTGAWTCAEEIGAEPLGYGRYEWTVAAPLRTFDPRAVVGLFTWDDLAPPHHREIDVEVSAWGNGPVAGQFVLQPAGLPAHLHKFRLPSGQLRCGFDWTASRIVFRLGSASVAEITGPAVPAAGSARPRMNLWLFKGADPARGAEVSVTIGSFLFTPAV